MRSNPRSSLLAKDVDIVIIEVGGTVGDIESLPFLEAIRQIRGDVGRENTLYIHLTLVPYIQTAGELKTKPTQHSVKELREIGIQPDILLCRTDRSLSPDIKAKIALFCNVDKDAVITAKNVETVYEVPVVFHQEGLDEKIVEKLNIWTGRPNLKGLGAGRQKDQTTPLRNDHRRRGKICQPDRIVQEPDGGLDPWRHCQ